MNSNDVSNRLGLLMGLLATLAVLGVLTLAFQQGLDERQHPNREVIAQSVDGGALEIRLESNRQGHYLVDGTINGHPVTFFVDTGATRIAIPAHIADAIGLSRGQAVDTRTAGGRVTSHATVLDEVEIGGIRRRGLQATINPVMEMDKVLLGMNFLAPLELNQRDGVLTIRAPQ
ncbi:aspartyl protease family protein [Natronospira proteinivora]|uniref:Aspartyl protease family protein n=1 Tax=Natronospira proteinivora TaxID=1807133 RepID=A0ABT1G572_9GAMM|nr:TIGR02281 family clan AA aspartic protease [Natronospira proteinivora]MCP1726237.1 aspartyl protease family protein [Natronospira proteinivora]